MPTRPHIVLITSDQQRYDAVGFMGNAVVRTPVLDGLAADGLVLENTYCSVPVCVPSRASIVSGRYGRQWGWDRPVPRWWSDDYPTLPRVLAGVGYRTVAVGKMHFQPMRRSHGFQQMVLCEHGKLEDYLHDDYHPWLQARGYPDYHELWQLPSRFSAAPAPFREHLQAMPSPLPEELYHSTWIADRAIEVIEHHPREQPLFLWLSFLKPHHPFDPPHPWQSTYDPAALPLPDRDPGRTDLLPARAREALENRLEHGVYDLAFLDPPLLRRVIAYYYASITHLDGCIGRVMTALQGHGLAPHTAVAFTSDHGEWLGNRNKLFKSGGDVLLFDDLCRVPCSLTLPGGEGRGTRVRRPVGLVDLAPTFAELAGAPAPAAWAGRSWLRLLSFAGAGDDPGWALSEGTGGGRAVMLRLGDVKYIQDARAETQQLYDLARDPGERTNRFADPAYAATLARLQAGLAGVLDQLDEARGEGAAPEPDRRAARGER